MKRGLKATLTETQKLAVGAECEVIWREVATDWAQNKSKLMRKNFESSGKKLDDDLKRAREARLVQVILFRPNLVNSEVLEKGVLWCWKKFGIKITRNYCRKCWNVFRKNSL